jgi:hypothetical protein
MATCHASVLRDETTARIPSFLIRSDTRRSIRRSGRATRAIRAFHHSEQDVIKLRLARFAGSSNEDASPRSLFRCVLCRCSSVRSSTATAYTFLRR